MAGAKALCWFEVGPTRRIKRCKKMDERRLSQVPRHREATYTGEFWWIDRFAHTKMLPCCWNGARIFSNICSKNGPAIAASMPHPHCMEHMGRHRAIQGFMVGLSSHSALHKTTILKYAPLLDKPTGLHLFPNNCYIYIYTHINHIYGIYGTLVCPTVKNESI